MKKIIIIGVIVLFICVGFQPAIAVEPKLSADNIEKEEDCDCQEEDRLNPNIVKHLITRLEIVSNILMSRFGYIPEVKEKCQEILNIINSHRDLKRHILCIILVSLYLPILFLINYLYELWNELLGDGTIRGLILYGILFGSWLLLLLPGVALEEFVYLFCEEYLPKTSYKIEQIVSI